MTCCYVLNSIALECLYVVCYFIMYCVALCCVDFLFSLKEVEDLKFIFMKTSKINKLINIQIWLEREREQWQFDNDSKLGDYEIFKNNTKIIN